METLFNDLLERYRQFRTFGAWYELSTDELKSFVENVRARVIRLQAEYQNFPVRVVDCEAQEFERMIRIIEESYEEGQRHRSALADACEACRFELQRLIDNFNADQQKISRCADVIEQLVADWESIKNGEFAQDQKGATDNERI